MADELKEHADAMDAALYDAAVLIAKIALGLGCSEEEAGLRSEPFLRPVMAYRMWKDPSQ